MKVSFLVFVVYYVNLVVNSSGSAQKRGNSCLHRQKCSYSRYETMIPVNVYKNIKHSDVYKKLMKSRAIQTLEPESQTVPSREEIDKYVHEVHKNVAVKVIEPMDLISALKRYQDSSNQEDEFIQSKTKEIIEAQKSSETESQAAFNDAIVETLFGSKAAPMDIQKQYNEPPSLRDESFHDPVHVNHNPNMYTTEDFRAMIHDIQSIKNKFIYSDLGRHISHNHKQVQARDETLDDSVSHEKERVTEKQYANGKSVDQYNINDLGTERISDKTFQNEALKNSRRKLNAFSSESLTTRVTTTTEKAEPLFQVDTDFEDLTLQGAFTDDFMKMTVTDINSPYRGETDNVDHIISKYKELSKTAEKYHVHDSRTTTTPDEPVKIKMTTHWDNNNVPLESNHFGLNFDYLVGTHQTEDDSEVNKFRKNGSIDFDMLRKIVNEKRMESKEALPKKQADQKSRKSITTERIDKYENTRPTISLHFPNIIPRRDKKHKSKIPDRQPIEDQFNKIRAMNYKNRMERPNSYEHTMRKQYNLHRRDPVENNAYEVKVQSHYPSPTYYNNEEFANERTVKKLYHTDAETAFLKDIFFKHSDEVSNSENKQERHELVFRPLGRSI